MDLLALYPLIALLTAVFLAGIVFALTAWALWRHELLEVTPGSLSEAILATMAEAVLLVDRDGRVQVANDAARELLDARRGLRLCDLLPDGCGALEASRSGQEVELTTKRGTVVMASSSTRFRHGEAAVLVLRDVTEARRAAAELRRHRQRLEELVEERTRELEAEIHVRARAERARASLEAQLLQAQKMEALGRLAGGVAHDFNNVLTTIIGCADMARAGLAPQDALAEELAEILAAAERATGLTRQLLAFSRKQTAFPRSVDLVDAVRRAHLMLRRLIGADVRLEVVLPAHPLVVHMDPTQLDQVLFNLAVNARDAMPRGGHLRFSASGTSDRVVLRVSDDGTGMDEAIVGQVFDPFFTTKPEGKGTGLGLSTVYGVVTQARGTVTVESTPGLGTTFQIDLPRVHPHQATGDSEGVLHLLADQKI